MHSIKVGEQTYEYEYTAKALRELPLHVMQAVIDKHETEHAVRHSMPKWAEQLDIKRDTHFTRTPNADKRLLDTRLYAYTYTAGTECSKCDGLGYCNHCEAECSRCDGSGFNTSTTNTIYVNENLEIVE